MVQYGLLSPVEFASLPGSELSFRGFPSSLALLGRALILQKIEGSDESNPFLWDQELTRTDHKLIHTLLHGSRQLDSYRCGAGCHAVALYPPALRSRVDSSTMQ